MPRTEWVEHVRRFRTEHPEMAYREALREASKTYTKKKEERTEPLYTRESWIDHVRAYRAEHGGTWKDALRGASESWRAMKSGGGQEVVRPVTVEHTRGEHAREHTRGERHARATLLERVTAYKEKYHTTWEEAWRAEYWYADKVRS